MEGGITSKAVTGSGADSQTQTRFNINLLVVCYLLPAEQYVCQVFADFCRSAQTHTPGIVNHAGHGEEGGRPRQRRHDSWRGGHSCIMQHAAKEL